MKNLFRLGFRFVAFASVLMAAFSTSAFAQEAAEAVAPQEQTMLDKWIIAGGWTMIPIMLVEAFIIFLVVKAINKLRDLKKQDEIAEEPTTKVCPFCKTEIPLEASRCPHCTSQLD